ncbi:MAG TPA: aminotransferase class I/II-fold pyridoxal phosphate-dependent enzyme, partial [Terriglobales bacterium]|nr:aminotransferase class I/II-fold pyridoxal phosphate-dependent enzyme [Terriglobales bacterium]
MNIDGLNNASVETRLIHSDRHLNSSSAVAPPIYQTATFRGDSAEDFAQRAGEPRHPEFYSRYGNPTLSQVESVLAALEGAESALVTGSGMAAVSATVLTIAGQGTHVVAQTNHYGGTTNLLQKLVPRFGVEVTQVDQRDASAFQKALRPNTELILIETPSNPLMTLTDISAVVSIAKARGIT